MFYITGDTHGEFSRIEQFCERIKPTQDDTIIILGDVGINYFGGWRDIHKKQHLAKLPITLFCIHGNHEMRPGTLPCYHTMEWNDGLVYVEDAYPNLLFAIDGEVYNLGGIETLVIGGAYSIDKFYRLAYGYGWWPDEQPSPAIKEKVEQVLDAHEWKVDAVLSHTTPLKYEPVEVFLSGVDQSKVDKSTEDWLDSIEDRLDYKHWQAHVFRMEKQNTLGALVASEHTADIRHVDFTSVRDMIARPIIDTEVEYGNGFLAHVRSNDKHCAKHAG